MKYPARKFISILMILLIAGILNTTVEAQDSARVSVILVEASNSEGGVDSSLRPYASTLKRIFPFSTYKQVSRGAIRVKVPGDGSTGLPGGQKLSLKALEGGRGGLMAELSWTRSGKSLLRTRVQLRGNNPAVLAGPRTSGGATQILILRLE